MTREIKFINATMDWSDMDYIVNIIPEIKNSFTNRKYDYVYNCSDKIEISIEQIDDISQEFEIEITSNSIIIKN